jgi:prevent-host-death family protein
MIVNIHAAKTHLSKLIEAAEAGEDVVIARNGKPAVKLVPFETAYGVAEDAAKPLVPPPSEPKVPSWFGSLRGQIWISPDFDADNEEIGRLMEEGEIFPREDGED